MTPRQHAVSAMNAAMNFDSELKAVIELRTRLRDACEREIELAVREERDRFHDLRKLVGMAIATLHHAAAGREKPELVREMANRLHAELEALRKREFE